MEEQKIQVKKALDERLLLGALIDLARKKLVPASAGTLPTHTPLFIAFLVGTVLVIGALTFVPGLALGPIVEQLQLWSH